MAIKKITCCTDFSENAKKAVMTAIEMAEKYKAHRNYSVKKNKKKVKNYLTRFCGENAK